MYYTKKLDLAQSFVGKIINKVTNCNYRLCQLKSLNQSVPERKKQLRKCIEATKHLYLAVTKNAFLQEFTNSHELSQ